MKDYQTLPEHPWSSASTDDMPLELQRKYAAERRYLRQLTDRILMLHHGVPKGVTEALQPFLQPTRPVSKDEAEAVFNRVSQRISAKKLGRR